MTTTSAIFRFAPSPNGELHLGHAYSALFTARMAERHHGRFLLRIEDIDLARSKPEYEQQIYDDLAWLGLSWQQPVRRQSEHFSDYQTALDQLIEMKLVYPSFASRSEIKAEAQKAGVDQDPDGQFLYPEACKQQDHKTAKQPGAMDMPHAWRLDMRRAIAKAREINPAVQYFQEQGTGPGEQTGLIPATPEIWGDVVIARKDVPTSYHLSVVVDDAIQNITHVTRGQDLFYATHLHHLLQILLKRPHPTYHHHGLIRDQTGRRLAKSTRDQSLKALRHQGCTPRDILIRIGLA